MLSQQKIVSARCIVKTDFDKIVAVYIYSVRGHQRGRNKMYGLYK